MPWSISDVDSHIKGLSAKQKRAWVAIANSALKSCMADGKSMGDCEGSAVKQANLAAKKGKEAFTENETLEYFLTLDIGEGVSDAPWSSVDKSKLPKSAFLWIEGDGKTKSQWHLPYKDMSGNINMGALRAISSAIAGGRTGKSMSIPPEVRSKIDGLLKRYKIGKYAKAKASEPIVIIPLTKPVKVII